MLWSVGNGILYLVCVFYFLSVLFFYNGFNGLIFLFLFIMFFLLEFVVMMWLFEIEVLLINSGVYLFMSFVLFFIMLAFFVFKGFLMFELNLLVGDFFGLLMGLGSFLLEIFCFVLLKVLS